VLAVAAGAVFSAVSRAGGSRYAVLITAGLLASAVGDVCLVWPRGFTPGLASFLVAHCLYLAAFTGEAAGGGAAWPWLIAVAIAAVVLVSVLWPHLGQVRGPVLAYVAAIRLMAWTAARRASSPLTPSPSGTLALAGALVFMSSDSVLALDRFARHIPAAHAVVMVTYYTAQTLIAASVIRSTY